MIDLKGTTKPVAMTVVNTPRSPLVKRKRLSRYEELETLPLSAFEAGFWTSITYTKKGLLSKKSFRQSSIICFQLD